MVASALTAAELRKIGNHVHHMMHTCRLSRPQHAALLAAAIGNGAIPANLQGMQQLQQLMTWQLATWQLAARLISHKQPVHAFSRHVYSVAKTTGTVQNNKLIP